MTTLINPDRIPYRANQFFPRSHFPPRKSKLHQNLFEQISKQDFPYPKDQFSGRGIVIGAGGSLFFSCAWACAYVLRSLGCNLPIQFWYLDRSEMDAEMLQAAFEVGIECIDASTVIPLCRIRILQGWELKPFSVIHSRFKEVLYLDADNIPISDPSFLFTTKQFIQYGSIFWSDKAVLNGDKLPRHVWEQFNLPYYDEPDFESGQFIIDKSRCWKELQLTMHLNAWSDYYYKVFYGDKYTFHIAWRKTQKEFSLIPKLADWKSPCILQHDFSGNYLFQHACSGKQNICGAYGLDHLIHHRQVYDAAKFLKEYWNGEIYSWSAQSLKEANFASTLMGDYFLDCIGHESIRKITLARNGIITEGNRSSEKRWSIRFLNDVPTLIIVGAAHKNSEVATLFLTQDRFSPENFRGRQTTSDKKEFQLIRVI